MAEATNPEDIPTVVKEQEFVSEGSRVKLSLTADGLKWTSLKNTRESVCLTWPEVIACHKGKVCGKEVEKGSIDGKTITVHYRVSKKDHRWRHQSKTFVSCGESPDQIESLIDTNCRKDRPLKLLVLINPAGGRGHGVSVYKKTVAPLFKLAGIQTDVIVSKHPEHPEEIASTYDFSTVDGIVLSGGDGTYHKFIHVAIPRIQKEAGLGVDDPSVVMKPFPIPIGMIPTGTGNGVANAHYGSKDAESAALLIICGQTSPKNLGVIRSPEKLFAFGGIVFGSGFFGDLMQMDAESRHLGVFRLPAGMYRLLSKQKREVYGRLEYVPYRPGDDKSGDDASAEPKWEVIEDVLTGLFCFPYVLVPDTSTGLCVIDVNSPAVTLFLEKQCGKFKYMAWMYRLTKLNNECLNNEFIQTLTVTRYRYTILERDGVDKSDYEKRMEHYINTDGEMRYIESTKMDVVLDQTLHRTYGTGLAATPS